MHTRINNDEPAIVAHGFDGTSYTGSPMTPNPPLAAEPNKIDVLVKIVSDFDAALLEYQMLTASICSDDVLEATPSPLNGGLPVAKMFVILPAIFDNWASDIHDSINTLTDSLINSQRPSEESEESPMSEPLDNLDKVDRSLDRLKGAVLRMTTFRQFLKGENECDKEACPLGSSYTFTSLWNAIPVELERLKTAIEGETTFLRGMIFNVE